VVARHVRRREAAPENLDQEMTLRTAMDAAMTGALSSSEVRQEAVRLFQSKLFALIPIDAAKRIYPILIHPLREIASAPDR
jgi:hypothetical protein